MDTEFLARDALAILKQHYELEPMPTGEFEKLRFGGRRFLSRKWEVRGLGNLCLLSEKGFFRRDLVLSLTPLEKDMPYLTMSFSQVPGRRRAFVEFFDLTEDRGGQACRGLTDRLQTSLDAFGHLKSFEVKAGWHDRFRTVSTFRQGGKGQEEDMARLFRQALEAYAGEAEALPEPDVIGKTIKRALMQEYCDTLVRKGGSPADAFKKALGEDTALRYFRRVYFGTENC